MMRRERIQRRRDRGQRMLRRVLLFLSALIIVAGLVQRFAGQETLQVTGIASPTVTPIAGAWNETMESREITLMAVSWYAIQTGVYSDENTAAVRAEAYTDRGAPGVVVADGDKWRVLIACFAREADASSVRSGLKEQQGVDTYLYTWECPELRLRMSGMAGQLDLAESGLQQMLTAAERLRNAATDLDMGEITAAEARQIIRDIDSQLSVWTETVQKRFSKPYPGLIASEMAQISEWTVHRNAMEASRDAAALSAAMKCHAMQIYEGVVTLRSTLQSS